MNFTVIYDKGNYTVRSYGNGWAYEVDDHEASDTLWFQDHMAEFLREETKDFTDMTIMGHFFEAEA